MEALHVVKIFSRQPNSLVIVNHDVRNSISKHRRCFSTLLFTILHDLLSKFYNLVCNCTSLCQFNFKTMTTLKRKNRGFDEKILILEEIDKKTSREVICDRFKLAKSTLSKIVKEREKIYDALASGNFSPRTKRMRTAKFEDLESLLFDWYQNARCSNIPISGDVLKEKARAIAEDFEIQDFKASDGWLSKFLNRFHLSSQAVCGESSKVNEKTSSEWLSYFETIKSKFLPEDIFNIDETGLFFNLLPERTYAVKGERCHGGEKSKQRLTVVLVCNSTGTEKLRPWVIGKSKKPRCFKNFDLNLLPCDYSNQQNSWIDGPAFKKWLLKLNQSLIAKKRKILLTMDNCRPHDVTDLSLSNITVQFFPANTTSRLQPLDQGIISIFKRNYRKQLVRAAIEAIDLGNEVPKWNVLDAIRSISIAWRAIPENHIKNCFIKAWSRSDNFNLNLDVEITECEEWDCLLSMNPQIQVKKF